MLVIKALHITIFSDIRILLHRVSLAVQVWDLDERIKPVESMKGRGLNSYTHKTVPLCPSLVCRRRVATPPPPGLYRDS